MSRRMAATLIGGTCCCLFVSSAIGADDPVSIFRDSSNGMHYIATSPRTQKIRFPEPNCGKTFAEELQWCNQNAPNYCKDATIASVVGIDTEPATCSFEFCEVSCVDATVVPRLNARLRDLETSILDRLDSLTGKSQAEATTDSLAKDLDALTRRISDLKKQLDALRNAKAPTQ